MLIDQIMALMLFANSERVGAGTRPCLNPGAYFLLGVFDERFHFHGRHRVDSGSPPSPLLLPLPPPPSAPPSSPPSSPPPLPPPASRAMQQTPRRIYTTTTTTTTTTIVATTTTTTQNATDYGLHMLVWALVSV